MLHYVALPYMPTHTHTWGFLHMWVTQNHGLQPKRLKWSNFRSCGGTPLRLGNFHTTIYLSIDLPTYLSSIYLAIHLAVYLFACLSVYLTIFLSIYHMYIFHSALHVYTRLALSLTYLSFCSWNLLGGMACGVESNRTLHESATASIERMEDEAWQRFLMYTGYMHA